MQVFLFYFALNEYTTVGSKFGLPREWRLLEGMIATAGLPHFCLVNRCTLFTGKRIPGPGTETIRQRQHNKSSGKGV